MNIDISKASLSEKTLIKRRVAHRVFDQFGPLWEIQQTKDNTAAQTFWLKVVEEYTGGDFEFYPKGSGDWNGPMQTFERQQKS